MDALQLETYLADSVERTVKEILRAVLSNPKESAYMLCYAAHSKEATKRRQKHAENGLHVPPFLICSITSRCNLHCAGCYARANHSCHEGGTDGQLSGEDWAKVFAEASELGIGFVLLAGGEPMLRKDVLEAASKFPEILFPIFTNGTMLNDTYLDLLDKSRNLFPVLSIEGDAEKTDARRGSGMYETLMTSMEQMQKKGVLFGASVTVTAQNTEEAVSDTFVQMLRERGCKAVIYVEYVPVDPGTEALAPDDTQREMIQQTIDRLRNTVTDMVFLAFPGDERALGGCLAAGRGFFHVNAHGSAEPCPFSPYSDCNVKTHSLMEIMQSKLFSALRESEILTEYHTGGCVLYEQKETVEKLLQGV